jgi:hypothetical protein
MLTQELARQIEAASEDRCQVTLRLEDGAGVQG